MKKGRGKVAQLRTSWSWLLYNAPWPPHPFELWLLLLAANTLSSLPPLVRADSTDTQCFKLSNSWQSVHHMLKWRPSGKRVGERWTTGQKQLGQGQINTAKFKLDSKKKPLESTEML